MATTTLDCGGTVRCKLVLNEEQQRQEFAVWAMVLRENAPGRSALAHAMALWCRGALDAYVGSFVAVSAEGSGGVLAVGATKDDVVRQTRANKHYVLVMQVYGKPTLLA